MGTSKSLLRVGIGLLVIVTAVAASKANSYFLYVVNLTLINAIAATGLVILSGVSGLLSLGTAALVAVGAYATGILTTHFGWSYLPAVAIGALCAAGAGTTLAAPALRLGGMHLAIVTLAFSVIVVQMIGMGGDFTGGMQGLTLTQPTVFGWPLNSEFRRLCVILPVFCVVVYQSVNFVRLKPGRALAAIRERESTASALGIPAAGYKTLAFAYSSLLAGLAGGLYAGLTSYVSTDDFTIWNSIFYFVMIVVGGMSSVFGGIVGAIVVTGLPEIMRGLKETSYAVFGVVLMMIIIFFPRGLVSLWRPFLHQIDRLGVRRKGIR
jgi:branched-chain amino acid transport system permease protein